MNWGGREGQLRALEQTDPGFPGSADRNMQSLTRLARKNRPPSCRTVRTGWQGGKTGIYSYWIWAQPRCRSLVPSNQLILPTTWIKVLPNIHCKPGKPWQWWEVAFPLGGRTTHRRCTLKELDSLYPWVRLTSKGKGLLQNTEKQKHKIDYFLLYQDCEKTRSIPIHHSTFTHSQDSFSTQHLPLLPENVIFSRGASSCLTVLEQNSTAARTQNHCSLKTSFS